MTLFGRNANTASGPLGDMPISTDRFHFVTDGHDIAVYDAFTGRYAPGLDSDAAYDFNNDGDDPDKYQWKDTIA